MGQKVHPTGIRLGIVKDHNSVWYADSKAYAKNLISDLEVRDYVLKRLDAASVSRVVIERPAQTARLTIHTARPGIVIGKKGEDVEKLRRDLSAKMGVPVHINIEEIRKPDLDARLVAQNVAQQLERRVMFRRAMKRVVQNAMRQGAQGIKVQVGGRLGGAPVLQRASECIRADLEEGCNADSACAPELAITVEVVEDTAFGAPVALGFRLLQDLSAFLAVPALRGRVAHAWACDVATDLACAPSSSRVRDAGSRRGGRRGGRCGGRCC